MALVFKILFYFLVGVALFWAYVRFLEGTSLFLPTNQVIDFPDHGTAQKEDISFETRDKVRINAWLIKAADSPAQKPTLLYFHGNAGNIGDRYDKIMLFHEMGVNVFIIDYRGYGKSKGEPTEKGLYLDALAAHDYLSSRADINRDKIVAYGDSLGGAVAIDLAVQRPVAALIAESTFTSAAAMARKILPIIPAAFLSVRMDSLGKIGKIHVPKLFIHSRDDEIVPYAHGQELFAEAVAPKEFLDIVGTHNEGYFESRRVYFDKIRLFLKHYQLL